MIKALSPYYLTIPFVSPFSSLMSEYFILKLYVWNGDVLDVPENATYEVTIHNVESSTGNKEINISNWIADFIDFSPAPFTGNTIVNGNNQYWAKWETYYKTTDEDDLITPTNQNTEIFLRGYGYAMEGKNTTTPANKILIPIVDYKVNRLGFFVVPLEADEGLATITSFPDNEINLIYEIGSSTNSYDQVKYIFIDPSEALTDTYIEVVYNGVTITLLIEDECKFDPIDIFYQNKEGALASFTFFKKRTDNIDVKSEMFEADRGQPIDGNHQFVTYNVQANEKFTVNTGFIDEEQNECIRQLLLSEKLWIYENNNYTPVKLATKSIEYKTQNNDKLINYAIGFEFAFNLINNI